MKLSETDLGREFESPLLHRKVLEIVSCVGGAYGFRQGQE